ncbi:PEP-CTERM sorting domain-containing protein [Massilia sp. TW-1]|uniref:PEP-CTERM sorting domain-containing protein n=1 Tax=Telluria antibiotica TaxID=2717319 RepID=A0ABX0PES5_9BURK|nr:PEP-CTERM sorting domain-containing protein [Telluria antibiotica]NIA55337.1 PEP-CTERM sorting domain-containing protein [Telluria antibiotica]
MKKTLFALIASASLMLAGAANAGVIGFEDVVITDGDPTSLSDLNPYAGLTFGDDWFAGDNTVGYGNAAHGGTHFAVNGFSDDGATISSATPFNFAGAWFAAPVGPADKASWVAISAYDAGNNLIGTTGHVAIGDAYVWAAAAFNNVSSLTITRDTGWYVMDDFTTVASVPPAGQVPEPANPLLLGAGAFALVLGRARRRKASGSAA